MEIIIKEFLDLIDLFKAQTFCIHKLSKDIMVNKNKNFILIAF